MLAAEKNLLISDTALEVVTLREKELNFYSSNIAAVQTMATLLAGFAFAGFCLCPGSDGVAFVRDIEQSWRTYIKSLCPDIEATSTIAINRNRAHHGTVHTGACHRTSVPLGRPTLACFGFGP